MYTTHLETNFHDRSKWPSGPWDTEPDKSQWVDPTTGYDCLIVRGPLGALCGYVGVPETHPLFEVPYNEETPILEALLEKRMDEPIRDEPGFATLLGILSGNMKPCPDTTLSVHGGLTFSGHCQEGGHICHVPSEGRPDNVWWLGFDCAHCDDRIPGMDQYLSPGFLHQFTPNTTYRDMAYVIKEVTSLAAQLKELEA